MEFLQQKEEIENKIKNIDNYWDDLKIKQQEKERNKREELFTYKEQKKHLYDAIYKLIHLLKSKKLISDNMVENYILEQIVT